MPEARIPSVQYDRYGGPDVLAIKQIPAPEAKAGEVVVEVAFASVNPIDWKVRSGMLQKVFPMAFPAVTGRDGAGAVVAVGAGVDTSLVGSRVCFMAPRGVGTWARQIVLPQASLAPLPSNLSLEQGAALPLAGVSAWIALIDTANLRSGQQILIHAAAGGVGSAAVQIARAVGAHVVATCSQANVDYVRSIGADEVVAYDREAFERVVRDMDVVFDVIGGEVHKRSYQVIKRGGVMVCLAAAPYEDLGAQYGVEVKMARVLPSEATLTSVVQLAAAGKLALAIERTFPLAQFAEAQRLSQSGHARGKTLIDLRS